MTPDQVSDPGEALAQYRAQFGLWANVPKIEHVHLLMAAIDTQAQENSMLMLCAHDEANEQTHQVAFPAKGIDPTDSNAIEKTRKRINTVLAAPYN